MADPTTVAAYLDAIRKAGDVDIRPCGLVSDQFRPIPPHKVGIAHLIGRSQFLLADSTGLGKSPQSIVAWAYAREKDPTTRLLAVVSKSAYFQFAAEVERFVPDVRVEVLGWQRWPDGRKRQLKPAERTRQYDRFSAGEIACLVGTYHTLALDWRVRDAAVGDRWVYPAAWAPFIVIFDECHILRSDKQTLIYPAAEALARQARAVWGLSATPISTRLMDLYHLYKVLRPGLLGSKAEFEEEYLVRQLKTIYIKGGKRKVWNVTGSKNLKQLSEIIRPYYLKRPPEIIGPYMPKITVQPKQVVMGKEQAALYAQVKAQVFPWVQKTGSLTADRRAQVETEALGDPDSTLVRLEGIKITSAAVALGYAQMALDAPEVLGQPKVPSAKYEQLLEWLQTDLAGDKVLVYTRYRQVAEAYHRRLRKDHIDAGLITGKLSATQREKLRVAFQDTGSPRVLVLNSAGKESLNLQAARVIVFLDLPWSWSEFIQVVGRARRYGSAHSNVLLLLLGATNANNEPTTDDTTLATLQTRAILVQGTFGLTLAESALQAITFDSDPTHDTQHDSDTSSTIVAASEDFTDELFTAASSGVSR